MKKQLKKLTLNKKTIANLDTIAMSKIVGAASGKQSNCGCSGYCTDACSYGCTFGCTNTCKGHTCNNGHQC